MADTDYGPGSASDIARKAAAQIQDTHGKPTAPAPAPAKRTGWAADAPPGGPHGFQGTLQGIRRLFGSDE